jgi:DNA-binding MarR family transcriptional regulator
MGMGHDIPMGLRAAYLAMHRQTDAALARHRVTADQFVLLNLLSEQDGITQQDLVRRAFSDANTVRAMLVRLEERGLVGRSPHRTDGRAYSVTLTAKGRRTYDRLRRDSESVRAKMTTVLRPKEADLLVELLSRVVGAMAPGRRGTRRHLVKGDKR